MLEIRQPPGQLEHDEMAHDVGLDVDIGIDQRMAHAGLGREVHDAVEVAVLLGQRQHGVAVGNVGLEEGEALVLAQRLQPGELQDGVVIGAEIVDADHRLAARQQGTGDVAADEAGGTGDEDGHGMG